MQQCPKCQQPFASRRLLIPSRDGSFSCPECGARFYLDQDDMLRRSGWLMLTVHVIVYAAAMQYDLMGPRIAYLGTIFTAVVIALIGSFFISTRAKLVLERGVLSRRRILFLWFSAIMGITGWTAILLFRILQDPPWAILVVPALCVLLGVLFYTRACVPQAGIPQGGYE
jgi:CXXC-20-CXXC protein